jgi:hypothetical protein
MNDLFHLAIAPSGNFDSNLVEKVASIINKDLYTTRLLLTSKVPGIATQCTNMQEALIIKQNLKLLGITTLILNDNDLKHGSIAFKARSLKFDQKGITFVDKLHRTRVLDSKNTFLVIEGTTHVQQETQVNKSTKIFNISATLLTGGIPIRRTVNKTSVETSTQTIHFIKIFEHNPQESCIEIKSHEFDYSCLKEEMAPSSYANFTILSGKIKEFFPGAIFDYRLKEFSAINIPSSSVQTKVDISSTLISKVYRLSNYQGTITTS